MFKPMKTVSLLIKQNYPHFLTQKYKPSFTKTDQNLGKANDQINTLQYTIKLNQRTIWTGTANNTQANTNKIDEKEKVKKPTYSYLKEDGTNLKVYHLGHKNQRKTSIAEGINQQKYRFRQLEPRSRALSLGGYLQKAPFFIQTTQISSKLKSNFKSMEILKKQKKQNSLNVLKRRDPCRPLGEKLNQNLILQCYQDINAEERKGKKLLLIDYKVRTGMKNQQACETLYPQFRNTAF